MDAFLHGELHLKLACLYEAKAELRPARRNINRGVKLDDGLLYDREQLLECLKELELGIQCVEGARTRSLEELNVKMEGEGEGEEIRVLHSEYVYAITRVKMKLISTIPPPRK